MDGLPRSIEGDDDSKTNSHFSSEADMVDFLKNGSEFGKIYGNQGQGSGRMPGFGAMLTDEQIEAVVEYVRSL